VLSVESVVRQSKDVRGLLSFLKLFESCFSLCVCLKNTEPGPVFVFICRGLSVCCLGL